MDQSLADLLSTTSRDYLVDSKGAQKKVSELSKHKAIGIYFSAHWCPPCRGFTPMLAKAYNEMKSKGMDVEIVFASGDSSEKEFQQYLSEMPWLAIPFVDREGEQKLSEKYGIKGIPALIFVDNAGKTLSTQGRKLISLGGADAFPFTEERLQELAAIEEAKQKEAQRKQEEMQKEVADKDGISLLETPSRNFVIDTKGDKVPVADVKKNKVVGLYFSAHWCGPCRHFTPQLSKIYSEIKAAGHGMEIVFVSSDSDQASFESYHKEMPWLALPFEDRDLQKRLSVKYGIRGIPSLVLLDGNSGAVISQNGRELVTAYGAPGYPFSDEKISELKKEEDEKMKAFPKTVKDARHEHPVELVASVYRGSYGCDGCGTSGSGWVYHCEACQYDLHPKCAKQE